MADVQTVLPPNGTPMLRAFEQAVAPEPRVASNLDLIANIKGRELPDWLSFLLWEYGLIEIVPYLDNPYVLIDEGRPWLIERDTFAAIARGLGWISQPATIDEAPTRRVWWNNFQLYLDALPAADTPTLERIERITRLGKPFRSDFRRGVNGYDGPALETGWTRLASSRLADDTGVRLHDGGTKWSFGREWEGEHVLTETEGTALGNWLEPVEDGDLPWADMDFPWVDADFPWASDEVELRASLLAAWFAGHTAHFALKDESGDVIGYRRARVMTTVSQSPGGPYTNDGLAYAPTAGGRRLIVEAMTDAGDGAGQTVDSVELIIDGVLDDDIPPGRNWLAPGELSGGTSIAPLALTIPLRATVRERIKLMVRF